jgi:hypothetical protein
MALFLLFHTLMWSLYTSKIFGRVDGKYIGDLARMGYQYDVISPRDIEYNLKTLHYNKSNWSKEKIDLITLGDSFSDAGAGGENPYYQDYIASEHSINILNIQGIQTYGKFIETITILINNGSLEKFQPKAILIESVSRLALRRFNENIDFNMTNNTITLETQVQNKRESFFIPQLLPINTANYKGIKSNINILFNKKPNKSVYSLKINTPLFSIQNNHTILVHNEDLTVISSINEDSVRKLNNNFNELAKKLKILNIKLIFMPVVDKYDLYYDYIVDNPHQRNNFFDLLRPMKKEYLFIDTKAILLPYLEKGIKDIYYADDTHWSYKASEAISKDSVFYDSL